MNLWLFVILVLILWEVEKARKAAESLRPPPPASNKEPFFTPGASWLQLVVGALGVVIAWVLVLYSQLQSWC